MHIYKAEAKINGLVEKIKANQSISYAVALDPWAPSEREELLKQKLNDRFNTYASHLGYSKASIYDTDLYYTKSILVSTNWNLNDDVFSPLKVWEARHTPEHKRTNLEHDEKVLVGHMTNTWGLNTEGNLIPDDILIDDLPKFFHLANGAVIYTSWEDDDLNSRTDKLISQIKAGEKYVSMEALFMGFDYAVANGDDYYIIDRNEDTAFLTQHLRIYGGSGEFDGCRIGRLLRSINFCGKGYVDKPANPESIIFNDNKPFDFSKASVENPFKNKSGVSILCSSHIDNTNNNKMENKSVSDDILKSLTDKQAEVESLKAELATLRDSQNTKALETLEAKVSSLEADKNNLQVKLDEAVASISTLTDEKSNLATELDKITKANEDLTNQIKTAEEAQTKANRISSLVDGGVDKTKATEKVELFANLSDDQFNAVAAELIAASKALSTETPVEETPSDDPTVDGAESNADASVLENVEAEEEVTLASENEDGGEDSAEALRSELSATFAKLLFGK